MDVQISSFPPEVDSSPHSCGRCGRRRPEQQTGQVYLSAEVQDLT